MVTRCETKALESVPERGGPLVELAPGERPARVGDREFFGRATGELPEWWCRRGLGMRRVLSRRSSANHIRAQGVDQIATLTSSPTTRTHAHAHLEGPGCWLKFEVPLLVLPEPLSPSYRNGSRTVTDLPELQLICYLKCSAL